MHRVFDDFPRVHHFFQQSLAGGGKLQTDYVVKVNGGAGGGAAVCRAGKTAEAIGHPQKQVTLRQIGEDLPVAHQAIELFRAGNRNREKRGIELTNRIRHISRLRQARRLGKHRDFAEGRLWAKAKRRKGRSRVNY